MLIYKHIIYRGKDMEGSILAKKQNQIIEQSDAIFKKYNIEPADYLKNRHGEDGIKCNREILKLIASTVQDRPELKALQCSNYIYLSSLIEKKFKDAVDPKQKQSNELDTFDKNRNYQISKVLHEYFELFHDAFYKINSGSATFTNNENFVLPSLSDNPDITSMPRIAQLQENARYINKKLTRKSSFQNELELLITEDGTMYFTPNTHEGLACWLNINIISLKDAIRIETSKQSNQSYFEFNSLYNHNYSTESNGDKLIEISDEQAVAIGELHRTLNLLWPNLSPINHSIDFSYGFGLGKKDKMLADQDPQITAKNLNTLYYNVDDVDRAKLRINNDIFAEMRNTPGEY